MAGWVKGPGGAAVFQDDAGQVHLRDFKGNVQAVSPGEASKLLSDHLSGYSAASADDLNAAQAAAVERAAAEKSSMLGAAARHVGVGVAGGLAAAPKLATALGSRVLGTEDPLADLSGRAFVTKLAGAVGGGDRAEGEAAMREQLLADEQAHPYASGVGEVAGNIAGMGGLSAGATALAGRAAGAAGLAGRAATVARNIGAATIEGAAQGADAASEQAWVRGDPKATAEQTLSSIGLGALFGAGASAGISAAGTGIQKLLSRGATEGATEGLEGAAARVGREDAVAAAEGGASPRAVTALDEAPKPAALESVPEGMGARARKWLSGASDDAAVSSVARGQQRALKALGNGKAPSDELRREAGRFLNESGIVGLGGDEAALERATAVKDQAGKRIGAIVDHLDQNAGYVDGRPLVKKLGDYVGQLKENAWLSPEAEHIARQVEARTAGIEEMAGAGILRHSDLQKYQIELSELARYGATAPRRIHEAIREARTLVADELTKAVGTGGDASMMADYIAAKKAYRFSSWAKDALEHRVGVRDPANRLLSLTDYGAGASALVASGGHALPALVAAAGNKLARERGMSTFAYVARKLAGESIDVAAAPPQALNQARNLRTLVGNSEQRISDAVSRFLGGGSGTDRAARAATSVGLKLRSADIDTARAAYRDHAREVQTVAAMPEVAAERLGGITGKTLPTVAPGLHAQMAAVTTRAAQYLAANMPAPPTDPNSITPHLDSPPPVSQSDLYTYANRVEGVQEPLTLLEDLSKGYVSPEKVEAVQQVWPQLYDRMRTAVFGQLAQRTEPVPYEQRKLLDVALSGGGSLEPSLRPDSLWVMQQAGKAAQQQAGGGKPSAPAPKVGGMLSTRSDQIASR